MLEDPPKLRKLAAWYRIFAEKAANPAIWEARLQMAQDLDAEADRIERGRGIRDEGGLGIGSAARARGTKDQADRAYSPETETVSTALEEAS